MRWQVATEADPVLIGLADRHYSRRVPGSQSFLATARRVLFKAHGPEGFGVWATIWLSDAQRRHPFGDSWICSIFRNETGWLSSELVTEAIAATLWKWPTPPAGGMLTFVNADKIRRKRDPGRCFRRAGFEHIGETQSGLVVLRLPVERLPDPDIPIGGADLWASAVAASSDAPGNQSGEGGSQPTLPLHSEKVA